MHTIETWLGDGTAATAARILAVVRAGKDTGIAAELDLAEASCREQAGDSSATERTEVLEAIVRDLRSRRKSGTGGEGLEAHTCLLAHLAGLA